ncbi:MAG: glycosyltransferase [Odoribacteraceae bacterium]|jgi:glycosyltransferase involved in cell wall biosynthesis|nr:glycosyltransferase [Odoribacteraceae bacterium]
MGNFQSFWENAGTCRYLLIALALLFLTYIYYIVYRVIVILHEERDPEEQEEEGVSVIITAHNRVASLRKNLIGFLIQDYDNYEVIVVDDCSEDDTEELLSELQKEYPRLKYTHIYPNTKFRFTKKLAINIGILSAQYDILLFSEANCYPASSSWVRTMRACFKKETAVVVGFSNFRARKRPFAWKRYFRFTHFLEMLLLAKSLKTILGDGCNMAYRKSYYMRNRGFAGDTQSYIGYDHDMVQELSKYGKVKVIKKPESYMYVDENKESDDTSYYFASKARWPLSLRLQTGLDKSIRVSIYLLSLFLIFSKILPGYLWILVVSVFLLDVISINIFAQRFKQQNLLLTSFVANMAGFAYRWYWSGYSFFNSKKWR